MSRTNAKTFGRGHRLLTDEQEVEVCNFYMQRRSIKSIMDAYGISRTTLYSTLSKHPEITKTLGTDIPQGLDHSA